MEVRHSNDLGADFWVADRPAPGFGGQLERPRGPARMPDNGVAADPMEEHNRMDVWMLWDHHCTLIVVKSASNREQGGMTPCSKNAASTRAVSTPLGSCTTTDAFQLESA